MLKQRVPKGGKPKTLTKEQIETLVNACENPRDQLLLTLGHVDVRSAWQCQRQLSVPSQRESPRPLSLRPDRHTASSLSVPSKRDAPPPPPLFACHSTPSVTAPSRQATLACTVTFPPLSPHRGQAMLTYGSQALQESIPQGKIAPTGESTGAETATPRHTAPFMETSEGLLPSLGRNQGQ